MNLVLVVPAETRGTVTQAKAVHEWCRQNAHRVVRVLLARTDCANPSPRISRDFDVPVEVIPGLGIPTRIERHPGIVRWLRECVARRRAVQAGLAAIDRSISSGPADAMVSFMEPLAAFHRVARVRHLPLLTIGHALRLAHPDRAGSSEAGPEMRRIARRADWCAGRGLRLALSLEPMANHPSIGWFAAPPLLTDDLRPTAGTLGPGLVIRLGRAEQRAEVERWHLHHPEVSIDCFYERSGSIGSEVVRSTLRFHPLDLALLRDRMARGAGIVLDGSIEDLAEAACLGKPMLHWLGRPYPEALLAAADAERAGLSLRMTHFNPALIHRAAPDGTERFRHWLGAADDRLGAAMSQLQRQASGRGRSWGGVHGA